MPLDPRVRTFLEQTGLLYQAGSVPREPMALLTELRANDERAKTLLAQAGEREPVARIENRGIAGPSGEIPVRLYTPEGSGPFPILVSFHGGGWVGGNLDTHDSGCRYWCREARCLVVSVDYRRPPEAKFPAGLEDCYAATCWMATHATQFRGDAARMAVCGDSGGGNFAAVIALMSRDRGGPVLVFQLLLVPVMDFRPTTPSWKDYDGYMMTKEEFLIVRDFYLSDEQEQTHPYAAPLLAPDLHGLPPALIITAECDPVRDGGEQYGQRLHGHEKPGTASGSSTRRSCLRFAGGFRSVGGRIHCVNAPRRSTHRFCARGREAEALAGPEARGEQVGDTPVGLTVDELRQEVPIDGFEIYFQLICPNNSMGISGIY